MDAKKILKHLDIKAKKKLGQNFLQDEGILNSILGYAKVKPGDTVLEIGAGLGILTERLSEVAGEVYSLEVDPNLFKYLNTRFKDSENTHILLQDILKYDGEELPIDGVKVIANLPYYISTPILMHLIGSIQRYSLILIMLQKELAERITASPGSKRYGSLTIAVQYYTDATIVADVPKTAFYPVPAVDSAVVRLSTLKQPPVEVSDPAGFFRLVRAAFSQRRKILRNALLGSGKFTAEQIDLCFEKSGISPKRRAETLSMDEFAKLARVL